MAREIVIFIFIVSAISAQSGILSDKIRVEKAVEQIAGRVTGRFLNFTEAAFMDVSQFTMDLVKKYFELFKVENNKIYPTPEEEDKRLKIFFQNFLSILTHNKLFINGEISFSLGVTQFSDLTDKEFIRDVCNCLKDEKESRDIEVRSSSYQQSAKEAPPEKDWRKLGAVTPVKQQDTCGSCWTFAAAGALEAAHFLATNELKNMSMQNLLDCSADGNCEGGHYVTGFQYAIKNKGINLLLDYPYENSKNACRFDPEKPTKGQIKTFYKVPVDNEEELKKAVAFHGPVAVGINSKGLKLFKSSGVYYDVKTCKKNSQPDHAVLVVGYGTTLEKEDYWIVKNSWGPNWGDEGYFKLARNKENHCHIAHDAVYPVA